MGGLGGGRLNIRGGISVKDFEKASTTQLWQAIADNAEMAQKHTNWLEYLDNIRVLCALIDERVETFQRRMRTEQLLREHRGAFRLDCAGDNAGSAVERAMRREEEGGTKETKSGGIHQA